jgi:hypothetical protein
MEGQVTRCTLGLPDYIQDFNWNVSISTRVQKDLSLTYGTRVQSTLGHRKIEYGLRCCSREKTNAIIRVIGVAREGISQFQDL